uniref:C1q domain-containing protein n=2 Tax=Denticeps clupeoides TaxID=299321 RepID=A0AAY4ATZ1_9TELE
MRVIISLLFLLFSTFRALSLNNQSNPLNTKKEIPVQDINAELQYLRNMVHYLRDTMLAQGVQLENVKTNLKDPEDMVLDLRLDFKVLERENAAQDVEIKTMKDEVENMKKENADAVLSDVQKDLENLKMENAALVAELTALKIQMDDNEQNVENLTHQNAEQAAELKAVKNQIEDLQQKNSEIGGLKTRLTSVETKVEKLNNMNAGGKVAFSAALTFNTEYVQAGPSEMNLVFRNIITNVGNAYSSNTGFFTAPVKGVYFFRFTVADILSSRTMYTALYRNQQRIMLLGEYDMDHHVSYLVGGVTLQLE